MPFAAPSLSIPSTTASRETVAAVLRTDGYLATLADHTPTLLAKFARNAVVGFPNGMPLQLLYQIAVLRENAARVRNGFLSFYSDWLTKRTASEAIVHGLTEGLANFLSIALRFLAVGSDVTAVEVVDAVYHIYNLFPTTHIAPSLQFNSPFLSGVPSTPIRTNSAAHMDTGTTHSVIDPKLHDELQDHLWVVDNDSFFDHFFPRSFDYVPLPPPFPTDQSEASVVKWVKDYRPNIGNANPRSPSWCWGSSGNRYLVEEYTDAPRKMDLYTHSPGSWNDWSKVGVVSELKNRSNESSIGDFNNDLLVQLAGYVRCVFVAQPGRRFVHGFTLISARMRCWVFTRSGGVASPNFRLDTTDGLRRWRQVALNYLYSNDIGQATLSGQHIQVDGLNLWLESLVPFVRTSAIITRGTTCWYASTGGFEWDYRVVLKESWRYSGRQREGELLARANEAGVEGIAIHLAHYDYEETVHTILGRCRKPSRVLDLKNNSKRSTPLSSRPTSQGVPPSRSPASRATTPLEAGSEQTHSAERTDAIIIPDRIRTLVVMSRGRPITKFADASELLRSFRDAIRGHHSLLTTGGILHRDVSINNIMMTDPSHPRQDGFFGFLIDLDLAIPVDSPGFHSGAPHRTGTYEFISIENLRADPGFVHTFHDDLQSFFFVFLWLCYQRPDNPSPATPDLVELWGSTTIIAAHVKSSLVLDEWAFGRMLAGFKTLTGTEALQNAARKARDALWPRTRPGGPFISRVELQQVQVRETVYQEFLAAFKTGNT